MTAHDADVWDEGARRGWALYDEPQRKVHARNPYRVKPEDRS